MTIITATPTQTEHPWRATARTAFAFIVAVAAVWGAIVEAAGVDETAPVDASTLAVASAITRIMALPGVEAIFQRFLPFLAATPPTAADPELPDASRDGVVDGDIVPL